MAIIGPLHNKHASDAEDVLAFQTERLPGHVEAHRAKVVIELRYDSHELLGDLETYPLR